MYEKERERRRVIGIEMDMELFQDNNFMDRTVKEIMYASSFYLRLVSNVSLFAIARIPSSFHDVIYIHHHALPVVENGCIINLFSLKRARIKYPFLFKTEYDEIPTTDPILYRDFSYIRDALKRV